MDPLATGLLAVASYTTASLWHLARLTSRRPPSRPLLLGAGVLAVLAQLAALLPLLLPTGGVDLGVWNVASLVTVVVVVVTIASAATQPVLNLCLLLYPLAALSVLGMLFADDGSQPRALSEGLAAHVLLSILAYALLTLAAAQAVLVGLQEHLLRSRGTLRVLALLPPLTALERLLFQVLAIGLAVLTLALGSGFLYLDDLFGQRVVHHTVLSVLAWVVFAVLLWGHHALGWRGRTAVHWTLGGFALLALAYFGSKVVIEVILGHG